MMRYATWYHLYNLKNMKTIPGVALLLVKLQVTPPWIFFIFLKLYKWNQIAQKIKKDKSLHISKLSSVFYFVSFFLLTTYAAFNEDHIVF